MRRLIDASVLTVSVLSLAIGFYDLYKTVPWVRNAVLRASKSFFGGWIDALTAQMRLSILLTFLLSKSPMAITLAIRAAVAIATPIVQVVVAIVVGMFTLVTRMSAFTAGGGRCVEKRRGEPPTRRCR